MIYLAIVPNREKERSAGGRFFLFSCRRLRKGLWETILYQRFLDMKYISEFKYDFTNLGYLHCAILKALHRSQEKRVHKSKDMQFFLQNVPNEIFKIFEMLENNLKFTRAACWINSKISKRENTTLIIFLFCHYCWSLLWCNHWKSLKVGLWPSKNITLFASMKAL